MIVVLYRGQPFNSCEFAVRSAFSERINSYSGPQPFFGLNDHWSLILPCSVDMGSSGLLKLRYDKSFFCDTILS